MSKNFELLQHVRKERNLFQTSGASSAAIKTPDYGPAPSVEIALPKPELKRPKLQIRWPELVKEKARSWGREAVRKNVPRVLESEKIKRREELKLVQSIFPQNAAAAQRVPQVVLFSGAEYGQSASSICARSCEVLAGRGDGSVCAVDASFESPFLDRYFGLENAKGLSEALRDSNPVQEFCHNIRETKLWVMLAGVAHVEASTHDTAERLKKEWPSSAHYSNTS